MCVRPMTALHTFHEGKWHAKFLPWVKNVSDSPAFAEAESLRARGFEAKASIIACGQCHECRLQRSRQWANRCVLEMDSFPPIDGINRNWFVTFTYADDHLQDLRSESVDGTDTLTLHNPSRPITFIEYCEKHPELDRKTLRLLYDRAADLGALEKIQSKDHLQMVNNALRKKWNEKYNHQGIRFYACGEYGDEFQRPHYHEILFNLPIEPSKLKYLFTNKFGDKFYNVQDLSDSWNNKGFVVVSEANWTNCAYVARYIMKKLNGDLGEAEYDRQGRKPPFTRMSRRPGIGGNFYKGPKDYFFIDGWKVDVDPETGECMIDPDESLAQQPIHDRIYIPSGASVAEGVQPSFRPPRYFDKLFQRDWPQSYDVIRSHRQEIIEKYQAQCKVEYPISDADLFKNRTEDWEKKKTGFYREFSMNF